MTKTKTFQKSLIEKMAIAIARQQGYIFDGESMSDSENPRARMFVASATAAFESIKEHVA